MNPRSILGFALLATFVSACASGSDSAATPDGSTSAGGSAAGGSAGASGTGTAGTAGTSASGGASGGPTTGGSGGTSATGGSGGTSATGGSGGTSATGGKGGTSAGAGGTSAGAGGKDGNAGGAGGGGGGAAGSGAAGSGQGGVPACSMAQGCAAVWEQAASDHYDSVLGDPAGLAAFLHDVPKGGDLHNHLSGAVYAETYLEWAKADGDCVNTTTFGVVFSSQCSATALPAPTSGMFFDSVVQAWSMKDFVPGAQTGHDHFFATFGKFGTVAGAHRDDSIADVAKRAADENLLYVETMFNLGKNVGALTTSIWAGTLTEAALSGLYDQVVAAPTFQAELAKDVAVVNDASTKYRSTLGCSGANPPAACNVGVRFIAQIARTGAKDLVFGQLISAFEMAAKTDRIVGANLSSPEDDTTSINNYALHMAMLDFLHAKYADTQKSPLHVTLHAGELTPKYLPAGSTANTFHIRQAVEKGHAERIGHGLDVLSETDSAGLLAEMAQKKVMVEVCLSSNTQILEVSGAAHPLGTYLKNNVPVALGTDDQGVSRSSMAGEYQRAALDQQLGYRQLKAMARSSLEHAFLPGASVWASLDTVDAVAECATTKEIGLGGTPTAACATFLAASERARMQWELERRFLVFESQQ
jgi:adenosine deaminase